MGQSPVWWPRQLQAWLEHAVRTNRRLDVWCCIQAHYCFVCSAYKYVQFWTYSAYKYKMALACLQFTTLSRSWTLSCIAEHGQCQSMAWLGVDTVIHSALARELTEYSNSCLHMCLTSKRDKTDTNIEYTFTEIWFALSNTAVVVAWLWMYFCHPLSISDNFN